MPAMADIPPSYTPPPPPPGTPPPPAQPGFALPPNYQGSTAPDYPQPYAAQPYPQQQAYPPAYGQQPWQQPAGPGMIAAAGAGGIIYQLGGPAAWSIGFGLVSIVVPFFLNFYFPLLPIAGFISAIRAIQRGRVIGGVVGIVVNILGGIVSLIDAGLILR